MDFSNLFSSMSSSAVTPPVSSPAVSPKRDEVISAGDYDRLATYIRSELDADGRIQLTQVNALLVKLGFSGWKSFAEGEGYTKMLDWAQNKLSRYFDLASEGLICYLTEKSAPSTTGLVSGDYEKLMDILEEATNEDGTILLTRVNEILRLNGFPSWKNFLAVGESFSRMSEWAGAKFSRRFVLDKQGLDFFMKLKNTSAKSVTAVKPVEAYPAIDPNRTIDPASEEMLAEIREVESTVWFGHWTQVAAKMVELTGKGAKNADKWKCIMVHRYSNAMKKGGEDYRVCGEDNARIVVRLYLDDKQGRPLYMVFCPNSYEGKENQKWRLMDDGICYPGMPGTGMWLVTSCGMRNADRSGTVAMRESLADMLKSTMEQRSLAVEACERLLCALKDELRPSAEDIERFNSYVNGWNTVTGLLVDLGESVNEDSSLSGIYGKYFSGNDDRARLAELCSLMEQILSNARHRAVECHIIAEDAESVFDMQMEMTTKELRALKAGEEVSRNALLAIARPLLSLCKLCERTDNVLSEEDDSVIAELSVTYRVSAVRISMYFFGCGSIGDSKELAELIAELSGGDNNGGPSGNRLVIDAYKVTDIVRKALTENTEYGDFIDAFGEPDLLQEYIISAEFAKAVELAENAHAMSEMGYSEEKRQDIRNRLVHSAEKLSVSTLPTAVGTRLATVLGMSDRQAERFWLMNVADNDAFARLVDMYKEQGRVADYIFLIENGGEGKRLSPSNISYLLYCYNDCSEYKKVLELVKRSPELLYQTSADCDEDDESDSRNIARIIEAADRLSDNEKKEYYSSLAEKIPPYKGETNDLESALINYDPETLSGFTRPGALDWFTYSGAVKDEICNRIGMVVREELSCPVDGSKFSAGLRLYKVMGDESVMLAEQLMWSDFNVDRIAYQMGEGLFPLLKKQLRYREIIDIYTAYTEKLSTESVCRLVYLEALLCCGRLEEAQEHLRLWATDWVRLYEEHGEDCTEWLSEMSDRALCEALSALCGIACTNDYLNSVILLNNRFRDYIVSPEQLESMGYSNRRINRIVDTYRQGYPTGDTLSAVGRRLWLFTKGNEALVERLARTDLPEKESVLLLCDLYAENGSAQELDKLFSEYPYLEQERSTKYCEHLLQTRQYSRIAALPENTEHSCIESARALAEIMCGAKASAVQFSREHILGYPEHFADLSELYYKASDPAYGALVASLMLTAAAGWESEQLKAFVTARGMADEATLSALQQKLTEQEQGMLCAAYIYNVLGIGNIAEKCDEYYNTVFSSCDENAELCRALVVVFPKRGEGLGDTYALSKVRSVLRESHSADEAKAALVNVLRTVSLSDEAIIDIFTELHRYGMLNDSDIISIVNAGGEEYRSAVAEIIIPTLSQGDYYGQRILLTLCAECLHEGSLSEDAVKSLAEYCHDNRGLLSGYCLFELCRKSGNVHDAQVVYHMVKEEMSVSSEELPAFVREEIERFGADVPDSLIGCFVEALKKTELDMVPEVFIAHFVRMKEVFTTTEYEQNLCKSIANSHRNAEPEEYNAVMHTIYGSPENAYGWRALLTMIPDEGTLTAKAAYLCARVRNGAGSWSKLFELLYADESLRDRAPLVLIEQLSLTENISHIIDAQKQVCAVLEQLKTIDIPEEVKGRLTDLMCATVGRTDSLHKELCALGEYAVAMGESRNIISRHEIWGAFFRDDGAGLSGAGAFAVRLLLEGDLDNAKALLRRLGGSTDWGVLFGKLAILDEKQLEEYMAEEMSRDLLKLALPDCARPSFGVKIMSEVVFPVLSCSDPDKRERSVRIIEALMMIFPEDNSLAKAMFFMCKGSNILEGRVIRLYNALRRLCCYGGGITAAFPAAEKVSVNAPIRHEETLLEHWVLLGCLVNKLNQGHLTEGGIPSLTAYAKRTLCTDKSFNARISDWEQNWNKRLEKLSNEEAERFVCARVGGDWTEVFTLLFKGGIADRESLLPLAPFFEGGEVKPVGVVRTLLRMYSLCQFEKRNDMMHWMERCADTLALLHLPRSEAAFYDALRTINSFYSKYDISLEMDMLELPLEEPSLHYYILPIVRTEDEERSWRRIMLMIASSRSLYSLLLSAKEKYKAHDYESAAMIYRASKYATNSRDTGGYGVQIQDDIVSMYGIAPNAKGKYNANTFFIVQDARLDICNCLIGSENAGRFQRNTFSYLANVVLEYIKTCQGYNMHLLLVHARPEQRAYMLQLYRMIDLGRTPTHESFAEREAIARGFENFDKKHAALRVLGRLERSKLYEDEANALQAAHGLNRHFVYCTINDSTLPAKMPTYATVCERLKEVESAPVEKPLPVKVSAAPISYTEPEFAVALCEGEECGADEESLRRQLSDMRMRLNAPNVTCDVVKELILSRRRTAAQLYLMKKSGTDVQKSGGLLRLAESRLAELVRITEDSTAQIKDVIFSTTAIACGISETEDSFAAEAYKDYVYAVRTAVFDVLQTVDLAGLIEFFGGHEQEIDHLIQLAESTTNNSGASRLYNFIKDICRLYNSAEEVLPERLSELVEKYPAAERVLGSMWYAPLDHLKTMALGEKAQLDDNPRLEIELFTDTEVTVDGKLFGQVRNIGSGIAEELRLTVSCDVGTAVREYTVNSMHAQGCAPFEVQLVLPPDSATVTMTFTLEYSFKGKRCSVPPRTYTLNVVEGLPVQPIDNPYPTTTITNYYLDEEGRVYSPALIGRKTEKKKLESLATGDFPEFRNALVLGLLRAGKSSLLHYLKAHIKHNTSDDIAAVYITLQEKNTNPTVYNVFINAVLNAVRVDEDLKPLTLTEEWDRFNKQWEDPVAPQIDFDKVKVFYSDLCYVLKKKLVILVDEVQVFVKHYDDKTVEQDSILKGLESLLSDGSLSSCVRFVLCGSNELLRMMSDGGSLHQAFQRIEQIDVGSMPFDDMVEMLNKPFAGKGYYYTTEALDKIYEYTGGAVWYTRLIGTEINNILYRERRCVVYPIDVVNAVPRAITNFQCEQFSVGCREEEKLIISALQDYTSYFDKYVSMSELRSAIARRMSADEGDSRKEMSQVVLHNKLNLLIKLNIIERRQDQVRFAAGMFRYYFRTQNNSQLIPSEDESFVAVSGAGEDSATRRRMAAGLLKKKG